MWKLWYKTIPTDKAIKDAIGSKLRSCPTTMKKLMEKTANITLPIQEEENNGIQTYPTRNVEENSGQSEERDKNTSQFDEDDNVTVDSYPGSQSEGPIPGTSYEISQ